MDMEDLLVDSFEKLGYEVVKVYSSSQGITKVDVKRGNSETTFYAMSYTVTDEVQDVVVDTVGDTTVGPVAEDVKDTSMLWPTAPLGGGLFNGITPQNGMKLTTLTITLPVDPSTTYRAVRQTNNALITCATEGGEDVPTAWKHGDSFRRSARCRQYHPAGLPSSIPCSFVTTASPSPLRCLRATWARSSLMLTTTRSGNAAAVRDLPATPLPLILPA